MRFEFPFDADIPGLTSGEEEFLALYRVLPGRRRSGGGISKDTVDVVEILRVQDGEHEDIDLELFERLCDHLADLEEEMLGAAFTMSAAGDLDLDEED